MVRKFPEELIPEDFPLGEEWLVECARRFGTPLYIYDAGVARRRLNALKEMLPEGTGISYSLKANPAKELVALFAGLGCGVEVSSLGEFDVLSGLNLEDQMSLWVGPAKSDTELMAAVNGGCLVVAESAREVARIENVANHCCFAARVALRINPGIRSGALSMAGSTQFGMEFTEALYLLRHGKESRVDICGIHGFLGTRLLDANKLAENISIVLDIATKLQVESGRRFSIVDVGGGFGVPLYEGEGRLAGKELKGLLVEDFGRYLDANPWTKVVGVESGRFLCSEAGVLLVKVVSVKEVHGTRFPIVDGGQNIIGGRDGYLGRKLTPMKLLSPSGRGEGRYTICGPLCTPTDRLAVDVTMGNVTEGDIIAIYQAGAYCATASPGRFLGRGFAREIYHDEGSFEDVFTGGGMGDELVDEKLKNLIVEVARGSVDPEEVVEGKKLREELGFDSVALVDLIVALEATFGIYVDPLEVDLTKVFDSTTALREFLQERVRRG